MKTSMKLLYWTPRILCILAILFISIFAVDAFDAQLTIWQQIGGFLIHMIPSFILMVILAVAWKWELVGGSILLLFGLLTTPLVFNINYSRNHSVSTTLGLILMITFPFIVVGALFIISHYVNKKKNHLEDANRLIHS